MKLAFLDLDKTLYDGYLFYDWVKFLRETDLITPLQFLKLDKILALYVTKLTSYESTAKKLSLYFSEILDGKDIKHVQKVTIKFLNSIKKRYYDHTIPLIKFLKDKGFKVIFVTNEPDFMAEDIKRQLGADDAIGLDITMIKNKFSIGITNNLFSKKGKGDVVKNYIQKTKVKKTDTLAIGDSINDFLMLKTVGKGFLICHDKSLLKKAKTAKLAVCTKDNVLERLEMFVYHSHE